MKRSELLALAERLRKYPASFDDASEAAGIIEQIAQSQPFAWQRGEAGESDLTMLWVAPEANGYDAAEFKPLYELPLED